MIRFTIKKNKQTNEATHRDIQPNEYLLNAIELSITKGLVQQNINHPQLIRS